MQLEKLVSFAIVLILLGVVLWRGTATGFSIAGSAASSGPATAAAGCVDNDLGFSPSVASYVASGGVELADNCHSSESLFEAVCNDGRAEYKLVNCKLEIAGSSGCFRIGLRARC